MPKLADLWCPVPLAQFRREAGQARCPPGVTAVEEVEAPPNEGRGTVRGPEVDVVTRLTVSAVGGGRPEGVPQVRGHRVVAGFGVEAAAEVVHRTIPDEALGGGPGRLE